jgi:hypothetical protein
MARRLFREFRPTTDMGESVSLLDFEADTLAEIIAEYVDAVTSKKDESK